jgi:hypothetical protein
LRCGLFSGERFVFVGLVSVLELSLGAVPKKAEFL